MIPVDNTQTIETAGDPKSIGKVTATVKNIPFLINAVTDRIYKDKPLAIIREYSTNAWDAHVLAKLPISEIQVSMPTLNNPMFRIRDFGSGLTLKEVRDIYCILGESTKRESNEFNGQLGLGCKSGFAYGDSFVVTSWVDGKKSIYNIIKGDDQKEGDVLLMSEEPMSEGERTGIEVAIPIKISDLHTIHSKAADFYKYWAVLPTISNMETSELSRMMEFRNRPTFLSGDGWEIRPNSNPYSGGKSVACMGQVAYPIDWTMLNSKLALTPQKRILLEILCSNDVILTFPIGTLKFTINREELEYTDTTYKNLENKVEEIFKTLEAAIIKKFADAKSIWDAKRIYLSLFGKNLLDKYDTSEDDDGDDGEIPDCDNAIKVLEGDFYRLEGLFEKKLFWNGILIDSPHFSQMHHWDVDRPDAEFDKVTEPFTPCLVTYRRKKTRVKKLTCTSKDYNRITPFNRIKVVILDGRYASLMQTVARYYLLNPAQKVDRVHILRFADDTQKAKFFAHYNFETAEYVNISTIVEDVKAWQRVNRKSYGRNGGEATTKMKYIDVAEGCVREEEVCLRDLEDGGVFVITNRKFAYLKTGYNPKLNTLVDKLRVLSEYCPDMDRVYCIPEGKSQAKWFQKAMEKGLWQEVTEYVKENVEITVTDEMKRRYHFNQFLQNYRSEISILNTEWINRIVKELNGSSPVFNSYANEVVKNACNFDDLIAAAEYMGLPAVTFGRAPADYGKLLKAIAAEYPMMKWMDIGYYDSVNESKLAALVDYIKLVDSQKKMLTSSPERV